MAQAFYPTNDGHIGNLEKLSDIMLEDVIKRQENLMKKKSFLNHLPDKGVKIKEHLEKLKQEQNRRKNMTGLENRNSAQSVSDTCNDCTNPQSNNGTCERLEEAISKLKVHDETTVSGNPHLPKHQYEIAVERAQHNASMGRKEPLKLNRNLNVTRVCDLPPEIKKAKENIPHVVNKDRKIFRPEKIVPEESAVVPPAYRYNTTQPVDLMESLKLQTLQKQKQEELHAQVAAEKLLQRFNIKMEAYNPEGIDMSYRNNIQQDLDSDDDVARDDDADLVRDKLTAESSDNEPEPDCT